MIIYSTFRLPKDYHKENMNKMRKKEHDLQSKIEEERNMPKSMFSLFFFIFILRGILENEALLKC